MNVCQELVIPPMSAAAFTIQPGQIVRIVDTHGRQPGDLVAFKADDLSVRLSQARTRVENRKVAITQGDSLWTNTFPPQVMFTIVADTFGNHDLLYPPCCRYALEKRFDVSRDGCLENLAKALEPWRVAPHDVPEPLNLFFKVSVDEAGHMQLHEPSSRPGSLIELKAEMDCIVAVSTCSVPIPGGENSEFNITIFEGSPS